MPRSLEVSEPNLIQRLQPQAFEPLAHIAREHGVHNHDAPGQFALQAVLSLDDNEGTFTTLRGAETVPVETADVVFGLVGVFGGLTRHFGISYRLEIATGTVAPAESLRTHEQWRVKSGRTLMATSGVPLEAATGSLNSKQQSRLRLAAIAQRRELGTSVHDAIIDTLDERGLDRLELPANTAYLTGNIALVRTGANLSDGPIDATYVAVTQLAMD